MSLPYLYYIPPGKENPGISTHSSQPQRRQIIFLKVVNGWLFIRAKPFPFDYAYRREWLGPGGLPGLQNRRRVALRAAVGSTPIHSRLFIGQLAMIFVHRPSFIYR